MAVEQALTGRHGSSRGHYDLATKSEPVQAVQSLLDRHTAAGGRAARKVIQYAARKVMHSDGEAAC